MCQASMAVENQKGFRLDKLAREGFLQKGHCLTVQCYVASQETHPQKKTNSSSLSSHWLPVVLHLGVSTASFSWSM